ncbi:MAG: cytochrome-c oxidase, cbb3-type subunit III [Chromatiales bacterium]|jgi:cytochrome c oxidase cbb3-type subunit 3
MSNGTDSKKSAPAVQTTGHAWDGDLQEYNNPLPRWWLWTFYASIVFAIVYWILYPAWPVGKSFTKGIMNDITFVADDGQEVTTHWNTRSRLLNEMQFGDASQRQAEYLREIGASSYDEILNDAEKLAFVRSMAKVTFADNCAGCHGSGGAGVLGLFPNLVDDDWLWGGTPAKIEETLVLGRQGFMPAFAETFTPEQLDAVSQYVLDMSGVTGGDPEQIRVGQRIFNGLEGGCYYCHTKEGTGLQSQGAANLTDSIWTVAKVPVADSYEAKKDAVEQVIYNGIQRHMPGWDGRLSSDEIKLLTAYVHSLGGGQ